ncbi:hypothetical protein GUJ93_ZPchr0010g7690 [Zizania palustris]|uniref:Uncharacterized protein n=1 Tax=Zizania palustris TaxID=103762 RepID=A0A8J5W8B4_ZIZPA|nr:hypothetical protein GUJ93_ZPchr0010g7690 [Zizania palustris]
MAAAAGTDLDRRVMAVVKASAARGDPPPPGRRGRALRPEASASASASASPGGEEGGCRSGGALAEALVKNLCFVHNTGAMWKLLDQAMASRLISPLQTLALLTPRVVPNRRAQPEAYRLYLDLVGRYTVAPVYSESAETKAMLVKSINDALHLSHSYGYCGLPSIARDGYDDLYGIGSQKHMTDDKGSSLDKRDGIVNA